MWRNEVFRFVSKLHQIRHQFLIGMTHLHEALSKKFQKIRL